MRESLADWERLLLFQLLPAHNRDHDDHDDDDDDDDDDHEEDDEEEDHHHHHNDPWIQRTSAGLWAWANRKLLHEPRELLSIRDARKKRLLRPTPPHLAKTRRCPAPQNLTLCYVLLYQNTPMMTGRRS